MFFRRRRSKELTHQRLAEAYGRLTTPPTTGPHQDQAPDLDRFLAELRPNEELIYDDRGDALHRMVPQLAADPLPDDLELKAALLARAVSGTDAPADPEATRAIGLGLAAQGGAFLMVLVAHRAQYIQDPQWKAKREEIKRIVAMQEHGPMAMALSAGGPLVARIERDWDGICGWQK